MPRKFLILPILPLLFSLIVFSLYEAQKTYSLTNHVVISEIQTNGSSSTDEFVELYNPTGNSINLTNWRLSKKTEGGTESDIIAATMSGIIAPHGFVLIAHESYDGGTQEDISYSGPTTISNDNTVLLYNADAVLVDRVGMGTASDSETTSILNPIDNRSVERKALSDSAETDMAIGGAHETFGNGEDTENNTNDFVRHIAPNESNPQNASSSTEVPTESPTPTEVVSPTPTEELSPTPTEKSTPTPMPSEGPIPTQSPTPTPTETLTPPPTESPTPTPTASLTPTPTLLPTPTPTEEPTPTPTEVVTPTLPEIPSPTPTKVATPTPTPPQQVIGMFSFPGTKTVCYLEFKTFRAGFFRFLFPTIKCSKT